MIKIKLFDFALISLIIGDIVASVGNFGLLIKNNNITIFILTLSLFITTTFMLWYCMKNWNYFKSKSGVIGKFVFLLLIINLIAVIRSVFVLNGYENWRDFLASPFMGFFGFAPLFFFAGLSKINVKNTFIKLTYFLIITIPLSIIIITSGTGSMSFTLIYTFFLILFIPYANFKQSILIIIAAVIFLTSKELDTNRATTLRLLISFFLIIFSFFGKRLQLKKLNSAISWIVFFIPIIAFSYGIITGNSVFKIIESENKNKNKNKNEYPELTADSRTGLYNDVLKDYYNKKDLLIGRGAFAKYKTNMFYVLQKIRERRTVEIGILQLLIKTGVLGVLITMLIVILTIHKATNSKSWFIKRLGLFVAFYWLMLFVENMVGLNVLNMIFWLSVGIISSNELSLNDKEIKYFFMKKTTDKIKP